MEAITHWAGNIVSYLVFLTALTGLLPAHKYEKYIRLFAGCILLLIALKPLTDGLRLEEQLNYLFTTLSFENEAGELKHEMDEIEVRRRNMVLSQYEAEASKEAVRVAAEAGFSVEKADVELEKDPESEQFALVKRVTVYVAGSEVGMEAVEQDVENVLDGETMGNRESDGMGKQNSTGRTQNEMQEESVKSGQAGNGENQGSMIEIEKISPVEISPEQEQETQHLQKIESQKQRQRDQQSQEERPRETQSQNRQEQAQQRQLQQEQPAAAQAVSWMNGEKIWALQQRLASFYQVEADHVEVRMEP